MTAKSRNADQLRLFDIEADPDAIGHVYAVLMSSHAIKIGWTARSPLLRARELDGHLLAFCFGTLDDERGFHRRLAMWRIGRTEDFWPAPEVWCAVDVLKLAQPG